MAQWVGQDNVRYYEFEGDLLKLQTNNPSKKDALTKGARFVLLAALRHVGGQQREVSSAGRALFDVRAPSMAAHLAHDLRAGAGLAAAMGDDGSRERFEIRFHRAACRF